MATRPFTYRWLLQQAGTQVFTQVGTGEIYVLTMPDNREVRLRVEVTDANNRRVTAEAYIACAACAAPVIASNMELPTKGVLGLSSNSPDTPPFELPLCADGLQVSQLAQKQETSTLSSSAQLKFSERVTRNEDIPPIIVLDTPYPNPAREECTVSFSIPKATHVCLKLYDMLGRNVKTIVDDEYSRGQKTFSVHVANLASGLYTLRLQTASGTTIVKNLTIIR